MLDYILVINNIVLYIIVDLVYLNLNIMKEYGCVSDYDLVFV